MSMEHEIRLPPQAIVAEQSVLGGLMLDPAAWDQIADRVSVEDFYRPDHRLVFAAAIALIERSQPCDAVTLANHLEQQGVLDQVGGLSGSPGGGFADGIVVQPTMPRRNARMSPLDDTTPVSTSWREKSRIFQMDTHIKGDNPTGYLVYTAGGHMVVRIAGDTGSPAGAAVDPDLKRLAWFNGIISGYSGTYSVTGNQITHHVESAWVPDWCGTDQIRYFEINGRTLTITTAPFKSTFDGRKVVNTLVFERVE